ncbi:MAG: hypothetical protein C0175_03715 [Caldisericum exile]|uniref:Uncharacterized protein n=1 Tax=Caldisericum exile TaxID=693075 RepID=A0A2J6X6I0_9BACT|nr:MAG: hypothetical protein C0175_03715 [Caldisericum exile]HEM55977.1 hypothetical protein [Thermodesulfobium narugense]
MPQVEDKVDELATKLQDTTVKITSIEGRVSKAESDIKEIKNVLTSLEEKIDKKIDKLIYFLLGVFGIVALHLLLFIINYIANHR